MLEEEKGGQVGMHGREKKKWTGRYGCWEERRMGGGLGDKECTT